MSKDTADIVKAICSLKQDELLPGLIDVTTERPEHRALPDEAIKGGCRDIIDVENSRRFLVSPFDFREIFERALPHPLVEFPKFVGQTDTTERVCYVFEIPLSAITLELMPDLNRVIESANGTGSPFESFSEVMRAASAKNPDLSAEIFDNPIHHWANDTEGRFILIFPIANSD